MTKQSQKLDIAFIHPDLGIGGAQQLVVNLALSLIKQGHSATIYTPYHHNSFPQTHDGTIKVQVCGTLFGLLPRSIGKRFLALMAYIRTIMCTLWMISYGPQHDLVVCDQVSVVVPILRVLGYKVIFYCHFPDKLLSGKRGGVKKIYRFFIDLWEEISMYFSNLIYVNSEYTKGIFYQNFSLLKSLNVKTQVLYPAIDFSKFDDPTHISSPFEMPYFLSLNRYERKKNINLAIRAYCRLSEEVKKNTLLVIAGGYDERVSENVEHYEQLNSLAKEKNVLNNVRLLRNISNEKRVVLLSNAIAILYTPQNEHFGIVPCEAQYSQTPVIASKSGGPLESVINNETGFLIDDNDKQVQKKWAEKMQFLAKNKISRDNMGKKGKSNVQNKFGLKNFGTQFIQGIKRVLMR